MVAKLQAKCSDCDVIFIAARKDGTMRKRCSDCHQTHVDANYAKCGGCGEQYHAILEDGRVFDKCYTCYQKSFTICKTCPNRTFKGAELCSGCYKSSRPPAKIFTVDESRPCKAEGCKRSTKYTFCKECNDKRRNTESQYMTYRCTGCGIRGMGDYKYCEDCRA